MNYEVVISGDQKYYPVLCRNFLKIRQPDNFPCFVKVKDHFLLAKSFNMSLSEFFTSQKLEYVYLNQTDLLRYTQELIKSQNLSSSGQTNIQNLAEKAQLALWSLQGQGINPQNLVLIESIAQSIVQLASNEKVGEIFSKIPQGDCQRYLIRTILSKLICIKLNFTSETTLYKITLASLLCDVGIYQNPKNVFHAEATIESLKSLKISSDISNIILHHHEYNDGTGPLKIYKHKIHPLSKLIRVCDEFCDIMFTQKLDRTSILTLLYKDCPKKFDLATVTALDKCFK